VSREEAADGSRATPTDRIYRDLPPKSLPAALRKRISIVSTLPDGLGVPFKEERDMQLNIARWGNSLALRLPSHVARETKLTEGATVQVEMRDGAIVVTPVRKRFKLSELLAQMPKDNKASEYDWGKPQGDEEW